MFKLPSIRTTNFIAFSICLLLLGIAAYMQYVLHLKPCPLCILQRQIILILGLLFLLSSFINLKPKVHCVYQTLIFLMATLGALIAGRHAWLETLPANAINGCGPDLTHILKILPLNEALGFLLTGTGHCREVAWRFLNLSIPQWTLIFFIFFGVLSLWQIFRKK